MSQPWHWYVYIIQCKNGKYYTGCTWNVSDRWEQHLSGKGCKYTTRHGVKEIVYYEVHNNLDTAREREKRIKKYKSSELARQKARP